MSEQEPIEAEGTQEQGPVIEEIKVAGRDLVKTVNDLIHEATVRRITVERKGRTLVDLPLPLGVAAGLMVQAGGSPAYLLASIMGPYRAQWKMGGQNQSGGLWSLLAWLLTLPLAVVFVVLPYALYRPALWATLPLGVLLSGAAFAFTVRVPSTFTILVKFAVLSLPSASLMT